MMFDGDDDWPANHVREACPFCDAPQDVRDAWRKKHQVCGVWFKSTVITRQIKGTSKEEEVKDTRKDIDSELYATVQQLGLCCKLARGQIELIQSFRPLIQTDKPLDLSQSANRATVLHLFSLDNNTATQSQLEWLFEHCPQAVHCGYDLDHYALQADKDIPTCECCEF